ncbi:NAD(P)/FAD-dependent oxidoreductase [Asaia astilbis]|uniref:NAD(P)/FAD-dependent oxidoreductase n=1 Tax=Asaia astilbis TaxID=610244 RepID=UPI000471E648|nr:FAD-binding oxidoreductase [Asaia astilbis]
MNPSLYARHEASFTLAPLTGKARAQIVVIGAGLTGLSAALHLAEAGRDVVVLDAHEPGWGASGRNGGQINPGLKTTPDQVLEDFGPERGAVLARRAWAAPDLVFDLISRHNIACDAVRSGTIRAATVASQMSALSSLAIQCTALGNEAELLTQEEISQRSGTAFYHGGMIDRRGGQLDPLAYTRGLALAAIKAGAKLHDRSAVSTLRRDGAGWSVVTPHGSIQAQQVILATNGYSGPVHDRLRRSIVPVFSAIAASAPLPPPWRARILAQRESLYELGEITTYYRIDAAGRLLMGGRSASRNLEGPEAFPYLIARARRLWPGLDKLEWEAGWNGQLALTLDHYPHLHQPEPGLLACVGYNGRGVAMATLMGQNLAELVQGGEALFPETPIKPIPFHFGWKAGVVAGIAKGRINDRLGL